MINPTMSQSPCLVYLHQSRVIHLIFKHLCRSCRSAPGVEGTNKLTSSLMGVIKCFYYKIFGWRMSQVYWNGYLFLRNFIISFVCRFWLDRKKKRIYEIFLTTWSVCWPGSCMRLTRTFEKVKWNAGAYFAHLATSAVSACGLSLSLIKRNINFT